MSLAGFQHALTAMTLDATLAAAVKRDGAALLAPWPLTVLEQRRLLSVVQQPGMALNCTLARGNRFAAVHDAFAMTCALLGPALRGVLEALWSGQQPSGVQLAGDAERFAQVAQQQADTLPSAQLRAYLRDVLAYEQQAYELCLSVRHMPDPSQASSPPRWVDFEHDPETLFEALQRFDLPPADLPRVPHRVRLALVDGELETAIFEVVAPAA